MQLSKLITYIFCTVALLFTASCANIVSSAVESGVVYLVASHDEVVEKKRKQYTALDRCIVKDDPEAYALGEAIAYGQPITAKFNVILSRTGEDTDPVQPMQLAYAFYIIADEIHDSRAKARMAWLEKYLKPEEAKEVQSIINDKFLISNLEKCFSVPEEFKIARTTRELILMDGTEEENKNKPSENKPTAN